MAACQDEEFVPDLTSYNGLAILIGMNYSTTPSLDTLSGTEIDIQKMSETFSFLRFAVIKLQNYNKDELIKRLSFIRDYAITNKVTCNRLAVTFSGHGKMGELYLQDGKTIKTDELFDHFSPTRVGHQIAKVQMFFVDTCRGDTVDHGIYTSRGGNLKDKRIPSMSDILIAYSTTPQHKAYESKGRGGLWLSLLTRELEQSDKAITEVLVDVNRHLRKECERNNIAFQTAEFTSYLTENIYLRREAVQSCPQLDVTLKSMLQKHHNKTDCKNSHKACIHVPINVRIYLHICKKLNAR